MATIYIDFDTGSDASPDATNPATPVATWLEAQSRAVAGDSTFGSGDKIKCLSSWADPIPIVVKAGITYEAADEGTTIDATGETQGVYLYNGQTLKGASVTGRWVVHSASGHGVVGYGSGATRRVRVVDVESHNNGGNGIDLPAAESEAHRCIVWGNGQAGLQTGGFGSDFRVSVVLAYGNAGAGVGVSGAGSVGEHITAANNGGAYGILVTGDAMIRNSIALDNTGNWGIGDDLDNVTHCWAHSSNRAVYHKTADLFGGALPPGCGTTDPLFVDAAGGNFGLLPSSPCYRAGTPAGATVDLAGNLYNPATPSMGAFELADTDPPVVTITSDEVVTATAYVAEGTADDGDGVGVDSVEVRLNGGAWQAATYAAGAWSLALTLLDGPNTLEARATDLLGNVSDPVVLVVTVAARIVRVIPRGTHLVAVRIDHDWLEPARNPEAWTLTGANVRLARVEAGEDARELVFRTDRPLLPAESYTLEPVDVSTVVVNGMLEPSVATWQGIRESLPQRGESDAVLVDLAAPVFGPGGELGGAWRYDARGDFATEGGLFTVEKIVWNRLLTKRGELAWSPLDGTRLALKGPMPDLRDEERRLASEVEAVPYVEAARVTVTRSGAHAVEVDIDARTSVGLLRTRRRVEV